MCAAFWIAQFFLFSEAANAAPLAMAEVMKTARAELLRTEEVMKTARAKLLRTEVAESQMFKALALQNLGQWVEADKAFRRLFEASMAGSVGLGPKLIVSYWKGFEVAGDSFLLPLIWGDYTGPASRSAARRLYRSHGEVLAKQGLSSLAAVEFERALILGDVSESLYWSLAMAYRTAADVGKLDLTLCLALKRHPTSKRLLGLSRLSVDNLQPRTQRAAIRYPTWVHWALPLGIQGGFWISPIWNGGKLIFASDHSLIRCWEHRTGKILWETNLNPEKVPYRMRVPNEMWTERSITDLEQRDSLPRVKFVTLKMRATSAWGGGGRGENPQSASIDPTNGKITSIEPRGPNEKVWSSPTKCPKGSRNGEHPFNLYLNGNCEAMLQDRGKTFLMLADGSVLRVQVPGEIAQVFLYCLNAMHGRAAAIVSKFYIQWSSPSHALPEAPMALNGNVLYIPRTSRGSTALDADTGSLLWRYPIYVTGKLDTSGPYIIALSGAEARIVGLKVPDNLIRSRQDMMSVINDQRDDSLAVELLLNLLSVDPGNEAAYAVLSMKRSPRALSNEIRCALKKSGAYMTNVASPANGRRCLNP